MSLLSFRVLTKNHRYLFASEIRTGLWGVKEVDCAVLLFVIGTQASMEWHREFCNSQVGCFAFSYRSSLLHQRKVFKIVQAFLALLASSLEMGCQTEPGMCFKKSNGF